MISALFWRRGRDSNPCGIAPKRFSRPPRYDRFDTSPNIADNTFVIPSAPAYYTSRVGICQPLTEKKNSDPYRKSITRVYSLS